MKASLRNIFLVLVAFVGVCGVRADEPRGADIEFASAVVDLGTVAQDGGKQIVRLGFTNTGDVPLVITEVRTSCSCMSVGYERKKVEPKERGVLTISLDPSKAPLGQYYRVMQVFSTAKSGVKRITVKAVIE
ncbi:MAG: DUF1573 domain-containing protein [Alistipes sp.]|nr:DUF1573 domain-containing protein [Alistipes sp.]MBO7306837.1 DUF1573 domain-containing protein [Alistipes sp.]